MRWPETRLRKRVRELEEHVQDLRTELEEDYVRYDSLTIDIPSTEDVGDLQREVSHLRWFTADRNHSHD